MIKWGYFIKNAEIVVFVTITNTIYHIVCTNIGYNKKNNLKIYYVVLGVRVIQNPKRSIKNVFSHNCGVLTSLNFSKYFFNVWRCTCLHVLYIFFIWDKN